MRDHLEIDTTRIHILQTSRAEISELRLLCGDGCRNRARSLAGSVSFHRLSEPIGQEMFFDRNGSHAHSSSRKRCSKESSYVDTIPFTGLSQATTWNWPIFLWQFLSINNISPFCKKMREWSVSNIDTSEYNGSVRAC